MNQQNSKNKKKKKGGGAWALLAAVILVINMIGEIDEWEVRRFFLRLRHSPTALAVIVGVVICVVIVLISLAVQKAKAVEDRPVSRSAAQRGGSSAQHSHDRIQGYTTGSESGYMHWKKQLDGFLAAGLIDRKEYNALLERRKDIY